MRQSRLFTKTRKDSPSGEVSHNAQLLIRAGYVYKEMAGVYSLLPLGLRVFENIKEIIRQEMNAVDGQEVFLTTLQDPELWKKSGRWVEEGDSDGKGLPWFKTELNNGSKLGIANTHEEALAHIMTQHISSHRDLPVYAYQFQNKFRNELRAKSGLMRGREFMMKDLYSFTQTQEELEEYYEKVAGAYMKIFSRVGLGKITYRTFASGGAFSKFSDEFQTLSAAGEDTIYIDAEKRLAVNKEVYTDDVLQELNMDKHTMREEKAIEVGNIFKLGTQYAEAVGLTIENEEGKKSPVVMGSYGIGVGRLMGTIVEALSDESGIVWPESVSPYNIHLVGLCKGDDIAKVDELYASLQSAGFSVLYDDRDVRPGAKFADSDLIGISKRIVISERSLSESKVEVVKRASKETTMIDIDTIVKELAI